MNPYKTKRPTKRRHPEVYKAQGTTTRIVLLNSREVSSFFDRQKQGATAVGRKTRQTAFLAGEGARRGGTAHGLLQKEERSTKTHDGATLLSAEESVHNGDA
jgi:hypothetical protein